MAHEFMFVNAIGEDTLFLCDGCGYAANLVPPSRDDPPIEELLPLEEVATPGTATIAALVTSSASRPRRTARRPSS
ncbi:MAG: hypothetical protein U0841_15345 [Chloroflexia bacterium]